MAYIKMSSFAKAPLRDSTAIITLTDKKNTKTTAGELREYIGINTALTVRPLSPTDPEPTIDGIYIPTTNGTYTNAGGLTVNTAEGGADYGNRVEFIKNGAAWVKNSYPLPIQDISGLATKDELKYNAPFNQNCYISKGGVFYESVVFDNTGHVFYKGGDIVVSGYASTTTSLLYFYDKYFSPISEFPSTNGVRNNITIPESSVPANTVFVASQARASDGNAKLVLNNREKVTYQNIGDYKNEILMLPELDGTVSTPTFDTEGVPVNVIHRDSADRIIRTDTFTFSETQIVETRVFAGASKTFTTDLITLKTTIS